MIEAGYNSANLWVEVVGCAHAEPYYTSMDNLWKYNLDHK